MNSNRRCWWNKEKETRWWNRNALTNLKMYLFKSAENRTQTKKKSQHRSLYNGGGIPNLTVFETTILWNTVRTFQNLPQKTRTRTPRRVHSLKGIHDNSLLKVLPKNPVTKNFLRNPISRDQIPSLGQNVVRARCANTSCDKYRARYEEEDGNSPGTH